MLFKVKRVVGVLATFSVVFSLTGVSAALAAEPPTVPLPAGVYKVTPEKVGLSGVWVEAPLINEAILGFGAATVKYDLAEDADFFNQVARFDSKSQAQRRVLRVKSWLIGSLDVYTRESVGVLKGKNIEYTTFRGHVDSGGSHVYSRGIFVIRGRVASMVMVISKVPISSTVTNRLLKEQVGRQVRKPESFYPLTTIKFPLGA